MNTSIKLQIPGTRECIYPGCKIRIGRFSSTTWLVGFGWFSFDDNRPFYGMYLTDLNSGKVKPLLKTDLDDVYMID